MMIGRDVVFNVDRERMPKGEPVLCLDKLHVLGDKGTAVVKNISFNIHRNEIFGIAGVAGNGPGLPWTSNPRLNGCRPSTSLAGSMASTMV